MLKALVASALLAGAAGQPRGPQPPAKPPAGAAVPPAKPAPSAKPPLPPSIDGLLTQSNNRVGMVQPGTGVLFPAPANAYSSSAFWAAVVTQIKAALQADPNRAPTLVRLAFHMCAPRDPARRALPRCPEAFGGQKPSLPALRSAGGEGTSVPVNSLTRHGPGLTPSAPPIQPGAAPTMPRPTPAAAATAATPSGILMPAPRTPTSCRPSAGEHAHSRALARCRDQCLEKPPPLPGTSFLAPAARHRCLTSDDMVHLHKLLTGAAALRGERPAAHRRLDAIYFNSPPISYGDLYTLVRRREACSPLFRPSAAQADPLSSPRPGAPQAAALALKSTGGPTVAWRAGRVDLNGANVPPAGLLPDPSAGVTGNATAGTLALSATVAAASIRQKFGRMARRAPPRPTLL